MPGHTVEITMTGPTASVKIDGHEHQNAVTAYTIEHRAGERPTIVTLHLVDAVIFDHGVWRELSDVRLRQETVDLLTNLGWTPPQKFPDTTLMDRTA